MTVASPFDRVLLVCCNDHGEFSPAVYWHGPTGGGPACLEDAKNAAPSMRSGEPADSAAGLCGHLFKVLGDNVASGGGLALSRWTATARRWNGRLARLLLLGRGSDPHQRRSRDRRVLCEPRGREGAEQVPRPATHRPEIRRSAMSRPVARADLPGPGASDCTTSQKCPLCSFLDLSTADLLSWVPWSVKISVTTGDGGRKVAKRRPVATSQSSAACSFPYVKVTAVLPSLDRPASSVCGALSRRRVVIGLSVAASQTVTVVRAESMVRKPPGGGGERKPERRNVLSAQLFSRLAGEPVPELDRFVRLRDQQIRLVEECQSANRPRVSQRRSDRVFSIAAPELGGAVLVKDPHPVLKRDSQLRHDQRPQSGDLGVREVFVTLLVIHVRKWVDGLANRVSFGLRRLASLRGR